MSQQEKNAIVNKFQNNFVEKKIGNFFHFSFELCVLFSEIKDVERFENSLNGFFAKYCSEKNRLVHSERNIERFFLQQKNSKFFLLKRKDTSFCDHLDLQNLRNNVSQLFDFEKFSFQDKIEQEKENIVKEEKSLENQEANMKSMKIPEQKENNKNEIIVIDYEDKQLEKKIKSTPLEKIGKNEDTSLAQILMLLAETPLVTNQNEKSGLKTEAKEEISKDQEIDEKKGEKNGKRKKGKENEIKEKKESIYSTGIIKQERNEKWSYSRSYLSETFSNIQELDKFRENIKPTVFTYRKKTKKGNPKYPNECGTIVKSSKGFQLRFKIKPFFDTKEEAEKNSKVIDDIFSKKICK